MLKTRNKMKTLSRQEKDEERVQQRTTQILEAAARVFARKGFHNATTKEIAAEAGVAEGTIYNYYTSKRDLLIAMVARLAADDLPETLGQSYGTDTEDARALLTAILQNRFAVFERNREIFQVVFYELITDAELRQRYITEVVAPLVQQAMSYINKHIKAGTFRHFDPRIVMPAFVGATLLSGIATTTEVGTPIFAESRLSREEVIAELVEFFLHGVARHEEPSEVQL